MNIDKARDIVIEAGHKLLHQGLVARTWGNISMRVDEHSFVITPSGRSYEELTENDIVHVTIEELYYDGDIKPSSEKGLHAAIYKIRPDVQAVIHTHQMNASTVAAARGTITISDNEDRAILGDIIRTADYALPGTKKLAAATAESLGRSSAALMANHGAVCVGESMEKAFLVTTTLEKACRAYIENKFLEQAHGKDSSPEAIRAYYLKEIAGR